eukprot:TRINITY_DN747_c0_g1_i1.p1 TRINITY_DN747_c0_g1~~TRINITY_DN747_c0_g1_i1.p1  ORF type:complete len:738 (+),score=178.47 TRINITY_DN747_c0_g1_i1:260-2215(+)
MSYPQIIFGTPVIEGIPKDIDTFDDSIVKVYFAEKWCGDSMARGKGRRRNGRNKFTNNNVHDPLATKVAEIFKCGAKNLQKFNSVDPFNVGNKVSGYVCKDVGVNYGSMAILSINNIQMSYPQIIFGTPVIEGIPKDIDTFDDSIVKVYFAEKWCGDNIQVYKYYNNNGEEFVSIKARSFAFAKNFPNDNILQSIDTLFPSINDSTKISLDSLPDNLSELADPVIQSKTFEICGGCRSSLVFYEFDVEAKPLFTTSVTGMIRPHVIDSNEDETGFLMISESGQINEWCQNFRENALSINEEYRKENDLEEGYYFNNFLVEGRVLYYLNSSGEVSRENIFKVKPRDIWKYHFIQFDNFLQTKALHSMDSLYRKGEQICEETMNNEMDIDPRAWGRYSNQIMRLVSNRPNKYLDSDNDQHMIVMMGVPGSGKSTIANTLVPSGWVRVNQDELGNRRKCESRTRQALQNGRSVVIDRCNIDIDQRSVWLKMARDMGVGNIWCFVLDIPAEVCKSRISVRKDHPTIPEGDFGHSIIDKFQYLRQYPIEQEGFNSIITVHSEQETEDAIQHFGTLLNLSEDEVLKLNTIETAMSEGISKNKLQGLHTEDIQRLIDQKMKCARNALVNKIVSKGGNELELEGLSMPELQSMLNKLRQ